MTLDQAIARIRPLIAGQLTHPDYVRCREHAELCRQLQSGNVAGLLRRFRLNESEEQYLVRQQLTVSTVPAVWHELRTPFYQVAQLSGADVVRRFDYPDTLTDDERVRLTALLTQAVDRYYAEEPMEEFFAERVVKGIAMTDPNAWLLTTFADFDFRTERARPYPVLLYTEAVVDFTRQAGRVSSMTARLPVSRPEASQPGFRYACYLENELLDYWPVLRTAEGSPLPTLPEGATVVDTINDAATDEPTHQARVVRHGAGRVPAEPIGYEPDEETEGRTFVSPLNPAICFLLKELNTGSELDIVMNRVTHPHKTQYVPPCPGLPADGGCVNGMAPNGPKTCGICHGTGISPISTSALEVNTFPLPKDPQDLKFKLSDMVHFSAPPVEIPRFQVEYQQQLVRRAQRTLFNTETLTQTTTARTATERLADNAQKNTALFPMARAISRWYVHHALVCAAAVDAFRPGLRIAYEQPKTLIPPALEDLEAAFADAVKAGLPAMYLEDKYKDLVRRRYADDPQARQRMEVRMRFVPFLGMSEDFVLKLAGSGYITAEQRVLRTHQDSIFYAVELKAPNFYQLAPAAQQALVDTEVAALVGQLVTSAPPAGGGSGATFPRAVLAAPVVMPEPVAAEPVAV
ncbi:hypothetical protein [Hymenobacter lapidiphilus]|uniref:Uncharacterized protein n=1 Tax=Hymenobacter lapidiphilus TaxID=2608003 RepID=A0A7Y7PSG9_9BACT|nr:hypothetical protein [Hymenobacter lapidiphilus]NVO33221.1 hypothetical protein [Hymenobacter lapidiphilus]